ncbi:Aminodeoxychorismate lyase [uncultured Clostridium sp.]|uniref:aminotransferase class IV n=1 Tax=uncultured Clostridium sp. TaxID=59620 RepID=UPI000820E6D4|nr:aminotransferase class IV [uncultured Clostridium sp.]SCJ73672.1 Aminodeoxychorismate lyase [uncultured Clostridium sp.]
MRKIIFDEDKALIDSGTFFGRGVFETILIKNRPHFLKEHIERLNNGITKLSLGDHISSEMILEKINEYKLDNLALKVLVTDKNIILATRELNYKPENYERGFKVKIANNIRNSKSILTYIKSINYLDNLLEYEKANLEGYNEAIFFNENNLLTEGCTTNVFIVKDNNIYTPSEKCGLLNGIIRQYIIDNFNVYEKEISKEELLNADEIFLTNSLLGVIKVSEIEERKFKSKVTEDIRKTYEEHIGLREV